MAGVAGGNIITLQWRRSGSYGRCVEYNLVTVIYTSRVHEALRLNLFYKTA